MNPFLWIWSKLYPCANPSCNRPAQHRLGDSQYIVCERCEFYPISTGAIDLLRSNDADCEGDRS